MYASYRYDMFDGSSAQSSDYTSDWLCVADYRQLALSVLTDGTGASRFSVEASLDEGFRSAIANTSTITTVLLAGTYTIDPGLRWVRVLRSSLESLSVVQLHGRT
jgi:hypothetical protein